MVYQNLVPGLFFYIAELSSLEYETLIFAEEAVSLIITLYTLSLHIACKHVATSIIVL